MKKHGMPHLSDITFQHALELSRALSGKTYAQIAHEMELGQETIHRYFTDPDYNPPSKRIPKLCRVLGNNLLIEWQVAHVGGHLFFEAGCTDGASLQKQLARVSKEFADVIHADAEACLDGGRSKSECSNISRELDELIVAAETFKRQLLAQKEAAK